MNLSNRTNNHFRSLNVFALNLNSGRLVYGKTNRLLLLQSKGYRPNLICGTELANMHHKHNWIVVSILFRITLLKMNTNVTQTSLYSLAAYWATCRRNIFASVMRYSASCAQCFRYDTKQRFYPSKVGLAFDSVKVCGSFETSQPTKCCNIAQWCCLKLPNGKQTLYQLKMPHARQK